MDTILHDMTRELTLCNASPYLFWRACEYQIHLEMYSPALGMELNVVLYWLVCERTGLEMGQTLDVLK